MKQLTLIFFMLFSSMTFASPHFRVGTCIVDISPTPDEIESQEIFLGGYKGFRERGPAQGLADPIYARALAIDDVVICTVDAVGLSNRLIAAVKAKTHHNVFLCATHSHGAPDFQGLWGGVLQSYQERVIAAIAQSCDNAVLAQENASARPFSGLYENTNRRGHDVTDTCFSWLEFTAENDGRLLAGLLNFAAHPIAVGKETRLINRDWIGPCIDSLEKELSCPIFYVSGIIGDVNPTTTLGGFDEAANYGEGLSRAVIDTRNGPHILMVFTGPLRVRSVPVELEIENPAFLEALAVGILPYDTIERDGHVFVTTRISIFTAGGFSGLCFPGEALTRLGLPLKDRLRGHTRFFFGLCDDSLGYFIPQDEWQNRDLTHDHEEHMSLGPKAGPAIVEAFDTLLLCPN